MEGRICIITGGTSGIGKVAAREIAAKGATVVLVGRDEGKGVRTVAEIRGRTGNDWVSFQRADLSRQAEIRRLARNLVEAHPRIDVLVNNAGALFMQRRLSADGIEMTFALNHLGYFLLTNLLLERLLAAEAARIVNVASRAHEGATIDFDDLQGERGYTGWRAYQRSKLANILFTAELARRLAGTRVTANALHPGFVATRFGMNNGLLFRIGMRLAFTTAIGEEEGARTTVHLATSPEVDGVTGRYFVQCREAEPSAAARDMQAARRLWEISERMYGAAPFP
jgi:retinol dehydrogenase 12